MTRRMRCQRSSIVTARSSALMVQPDEAWDLDHGVVALVVVVGVQPEGVERLATPGAAVAVLAPAADPHDLPTKLQTRVEALPSPVAAVAALDQPHRHAARLPTRERLKLGRRR